MKIDKRYTTKFVIHLNKLDTMICIARSGTAAEYGKKEDQQ